MEYHEEKRLNRVVSQMMRAELIEKMEKERGARKEGIIERDAYIAIARLCENYSPFIRASPQRYNYAGQIAAVTPLLYALTRSSLKLTLEEKQAGYDLLKIVYPELFV